MKKEPKTRHVIGRIGASYPRLSTLLVPLDFSGKSRQALRFAIPLARKFRSKIHLLHVVNPPGYVAAEMNLPLPTPSSLRIAAQKRLATMAEQLVPADVRVGWDVRTGQPAKQILLACEQHNVDMIVLTTKGKTGLKRLLLGSTAEYIMRHADCPVLSVRRR